MTTTKLTGLPFTSGETVKASWVKTTTEGMKKLTKTNPITFAGNNGALTVWWGADWQWHAHRHYHMALRDELACKTKKQIRQWLTDAFPIVR